MSSPEISIIIPHALGSMLLDCLESVYLNSQEISFEIIVMNDGTHSKNILSEVREKFPQVRIFSTGGGEGFSRTCNLGSKKARAKYLFFLNDDVLVNKNWLAPLIREMNSDPSLGVCAPKVLSLKHSQFFDYSGGCGGLMDRFGFTFTRGRIFQSIEKDMGQYDFPMDVFWVSGCAMLVRKELFSRAGRFDPIFFMQMEEIDICWRIQRMGFRIKVQPAASVRHFGGYSMSEGSLKKTYFNHRNNLITLLKNFSMAKLLWLFPLRICFELMAIGYSILKPREWRHGVSVVLAMLWLMTHPYQIWRSRVRSIGQTQPGETTSLRGIYQGSIVFCYFLYSEKTTSALSQFGKQQRGADFLLGRRSLFPNWKTN